MADSVKIVDSEYMKRLHSNIHSGHVHKGYSMVAANASIPTKYQTVVTDNTDKKGFLSQAKRFKDDSSLTESPSPGTYNRLGAGNSTSPSFSKKGTGSFASRSKRQLRYSDSSAPGPGIYALPSLLSTRKDFNRCRVERLFQLPIAKASRKTIGVPAPNAYEVLTYKGGKSNNVTANAAFKSRSKRDLAEVSDQKGNPAPGQYEVNDTLLRDSVKVPFSSFKSMSKRQMQPDSDATPGPGAYSPNAPIDYPSKLIFPKRHYLCISAPAVALPATPPSPGPGAYEIRGFEGAPKHYMSSAAFVSTTSRWTVPHAEVDLPGPSHYRPSRVGKQSFLYNSARKWI
ncbi:unnamed protein product [Candidula unifasciata]|uniref:O(6)-methylguanine-induced apoptosis 2 n=1 Tax=Candidula unifasciata TaxID=100452 RepID=A0A8S3YUV6_9EUPU|nr:unnamed protein product [Candidula unifasciata]